MTPLDDINRWISLFASHGLADLPEAALMDRVDTKYLMSLSCLGGLLHEIGKHCSVLIVDDRRVSRYRTHYYDTPDLRHYQAHHNGLLNRYKVRCRTYVGQRSSYLEVKRKNNKGRTIKRRIAVDGPGIATLAKHGDFLRGCGVSPIEQLIETQTCEYHRASFDSRATGERLTVDFDLSYEDSHGRRISVADLAILELKQPTIEHGSGLCNVLRQYQCRACGFSKYCIGMCLLRGASLKSNRFKETLLRIDKLRGGGERTAAGLDRGAGADHY